MSQTTSTNIGYIAFITLSAAIGGFLFGFDSSVINGANIALKTHFNISDYMLGGLVSLTLIGAAAGAYFAGRIADRFGRIPCMMAAALLFIVSAIGSGAPFGIYDFIAWRLVGGIGMGIASITTPIYIAETAPAHMRGRLGSMQQLAIVTGIFFALLSNYIIVTIAGSANNIIFSGFYAWQVMFWMEAIPATIYGIVLLRLPESPRHLVRLGRFHEASAILQKIDPNSVYDEIENIHVTYRNESSTTLSDLFVFHNGRYRLAPIVWAGIGLAIFQQCVGINVIFYYSTLLWQSVGFGENNSFLFSFISSSINLIMTFIAIFLIDRIGRKPLLLIGSVGMSITLLIIGICFINGIDNGVHCSNLNGPIALVAANLYVAFFAATWGPVMWVMLGEMFNNRIRAIAIAVCGLAQWLTNFLVTWSFPVLTGEHGIGAGKTYLLYAFFAIASIFFVAIFIKETKGKSLEQM